MVFPRNSAGTSPRLAKVPWHPPKPKARPVGPQPPAVPVPPVAQVAPAQHWWDWNAWDEHAAKRLGLRGRWELARHIYIYII